MSALTVTAKKKLVQREKVKNFWLLRWQNFRLWMYSLLGVLVLLVLSDVLAVGIKGAELYLPNWKELIISLIVAFLGIMLDDKFGGSKLILTPEAWARMKRNAFIIGLGALGAISRISGGSF